MAKVGLKAAWKRGVVAALKGQPLTANPFPLEPELYESWNDGWRIADEDRRDRSALSAGRARLNLEDREQVMGKDPAEHFKFNSFDWPPTHGLGSEKQAWMQCSLRLGDINHRLAELLKEQSNYIAYLEAEVAQLRAERKPKGGPPKVSERTVAAIRADLAAGLSERQAAARNGVSAMTVRDWRKR